MLQQVERSLLEQVFGTLRGLDVNQSLAARGLTQSKPHQLFPVFFSCGYFAGNLDNRLSQYPLNQRLKRFEIEVSRRSFDGR